MNVIVFASRKGGSGKSTLAAHLAAQIKATKSCLLIDADPQGSLTLWHKLRGTNEPPIKPAVNSIGGILAQARRDGVEWVLVDTPPNLSAVARSPYGAAPRCCGLCCQLLPAPPLFPTFCLLL